MPLGSPSTLDLLKEQCNRYANGTCSTRRCLVRGDYIAKGDYEGATCEFHEAVVAIEERDSLRRQNERLEHQYRACKGANEGLDKAMWAARDLIAEIDGELDRQLHDDEFVRQCRNNDLDIPSDCEHHVIIKHELWAKISEAAEPSKSSDYPYPENEPAF